MLGATICFAMNGIAFGQAGSAAQGGAAGQGTSSGQSGAAGQGGSAGQGSTAGHTGSTSQSGAGHAAGSATSGADTASAGHSGAMTADHKFAQEAAAGGAAEVQLGQLAADKATNEKVKQFGQRMVTDHTKANNELKALAEKKGITLSDTPKSKDKSAMDKLSKMSGPAFDKAYMQNMVKDHQKDVAEFQKEASNGTDPDLKAWAGTTLPVLQEHLRMAKEAMSAVSSSGGAGTTGSSQDTGK